MQLNIPATIKKTYDFSRKNIKTSYEIQNISNTRNEYIFSVEMNLAISPAEIQSFLIDSRQNNSVEQFLSSASSEQKASIEKANKVAIACGISGLSVSLSSMHSMKADLASLSAVSPGKQIIRQGLCFGFSWHIALNPDEFWQNELLLTLLD